MPRTKPEPGNDAMSPAVRTANNPPQSPVANRKNEVVSHSVAALSLSPEERHLRIQLAAYRRAETRGFEQGMEEEDWLAAEHEVDSAIND